MRKKITVVGAGSVGSSCAQRIAENGYADVVLLDIVEGLPQGRALDILQSGPVEAFDSRLVGTNSYQETANSDIAIITAGVTRKPGVSRDDLLLTNMEIVRDATQSVVEFSPNCIIIVATNPLDAMSQLALQVSKFPRQRVIGMSGILDTARFRTMLARELDVSVEDIFACVLGGHGDTMVPLPRLTTVGGVPITDILPTDALDRIIARTIAGGGEIVGLLGGGSACYAPSAAIAQMVDSIILDRKRILPCSVYLEGEYGIRGLFVGVPVKLGAGGIEQIIEIRLTPEEDEVLKRSAEAVRELVNIMRL